MSQLLAGLRVRDVVDIVIVAFVLYRVLLILRGTVAIQMLAGLGLLMAARFASRQADLRSLSFVLENFWAFWVLALIVLFQPELRRALAQAGRNPMLQRMAGQAGAARRELLREVARAVDALAVKRIGALVAVERQVGLRAYAELGVPLEAVVSAELLGSLFQPGSPLHDGAALIQGDRITAAGCFLPLSRNLGLSRTLGTRHRAAVGLSEETDAVIVVVSEETGVISLAVDGVLERGLEAERLQERLAELLSVGDGPSRSRSLLGRGPTPDGAEQGVTGLRTLLLENWPLKLASVAFAAGLWLFVGAEDRTDAVFTVPLDLVDQPPHVEVVSLGVETVIVRVEGRRSRLRALREEDFRAEVSLKGAQPGRFVARIQPENVLAPPGVRIVRVTPSDVRGVLEAR